MRELTEKEKAFAKQDERHLKALANAKMKNLKRAFQKKEQPKRQVVDERELAKKVIKDYQKDEQYQKDKEKIRFLEKKKKFDSSRIGKFVKILRMAQRNKMNTQMQRPIMSQAQRQQQITAQQHYDWVTSNFNMKSQNNPLALLDRQISGINANLVDMTAFNIANQDLQDIEKEIRRNINPSFQFGRVGFEVDLLSNIIK